MSRCETGEREADYKTLILLADYFDVSVDYLLDRTDAPTFHK
ncbi:helix-turn-helix transcriptional regulator [Ruminococcus sp.]|nr:helix-turn-helix transcriptional regulator [Ruminococcus sp.]MBQ8966232.1 helix-turn-helix transcriptional regulator [Ruminococcus sp.]